MAAFRERRVEKVYWALVIAPPPAETGELLHYLQKDTARNRVDIVAPGTKDAQKALLHYRYLRATGSLHLLEIRPYTGRPHQIRAQLAAIGCSIAGDLKYGAPTALPQGAIALHSRALYLEHPVRREPLHLEAPLADAPYWANIR